MATVIHPADFQTLPRSVASDAGQRRAVVFASTVGTSLGLSQTFLAVFGVVLVPITKDFGWSRTLVSGVMSLTFMKSVALALVVGWLLDRFGPRRVLLISLGVYAAALLLFALSPRSVGGFYALFALVCMVGAPASPTTFSKALAGWFDEGRGAKMGLTAGIGTGVGSAVFPILAGTMLPVFGWRGVFVGVAAVIVVVGLPVAYFFFRDPPTAGEQSRPAVAAAVGTEVPSFTLGEALRTPLFWCLMASIGSCAGCMTAMFSQLVPVAQDAGFSLRDAVAAMTVFASVCAVAQGLLGALIDRFSRPRVMVPFYLVGTLGLWLIHHSGGVPWLLTSSALMGVSIGAEYSALPLLLSRYFGIAHFGKIACFAYGVVAVITGLIPVGMNAVFDATGGYGLAITLMEIGLLVSTTLIALLPSYRRAPAPGDLGRPLARSAWRRW